MTQTVFRFEEVIAQLRHALSMDTATAPTIEQHGLGERIAGQAVNDDYIRGVDKFVRFADARDARAPYRAKRFEDRPCPVCGSFVCGGC